MARKEMMEAEMDDHLGYDKSERNGDDDEDRDYRNGYKPKRINLSLEAWTLLIRLCRRLRNGRTDRSRPFATR